MRLIDADALKRRIIHKLAISDALYMLPGEKAIYEEIEKSPTIDAVKHGRWIAQKGGGYCCSECGSYSLDEVDGAFIHVSARTRYCHNCGSRMEREE